MENSTVFCTSCGTRISASDRVCFNCGAKNDNYRPSDEVTRPVEDAPAPTAPKGNLFDKFKALKKPVRIGILGGAAAVILVVVLLIVLLGGGYKGALKTAIEYVKSPNISTMKKMIPDDAVSYFTDEYYYGDENAFWDYVERNAVDELPFGMELDISYNIISDEKMSSYEFYELRDDYEGKLEYCGMSPNKLTEARVVVLDVTMSYFGDEESYNNDFTLIKYDGEWYVLDFLEDLYYDL